MIPDVRASEGVRGTHRLRHQAVSAPGPQRPRPHLEQVPWEPPADLQARWEGTRAFEADIFATLRQALPPERWRNLSGLPGREAVVDATVAAMDERVELILGGWLPDDESSGRTDDPTSCSASTTATSPATEMAQDRPDRPGEALRYSRRQGPPTC